MIGMETEGELCRARVHGEMTIYSAAQLRRELAAAMDEPRDLELDLEGVTDIDSAGIQLLMLLKRERDAHDRKLALSNHSSTVLDVFELMGLIGYFNDPVVLTKTRGGNHGS